MPQGSAERPRYAVLFRTHIWDAYVERQYRRLRERMPGGDLYVLLDETNGPVATGKPNVVSHTNASITALGLAAAGDGNLLWYNGDYPLYYFYDTHPDYDYYVMTEYDVGVHRDLDALVARAARAEAGLVSLTKGEAVADWAHAESCHDVYAPASVRKRLICFALFSRAAVQALYDRRRALSAAHARGDLRRWPFCEAYIPTELAERGFKLMELSEFGSTARYDWWPPVIESDLPHLSDEAFVHPVLDDRRYVDSTLRIFRASELLSSRSPLRSRLSKVPVRVYGPRLAEVCRRRLGNVVRRHLPWAA